MSSAAVDPCDPARVMTNTLRFAMAALLCAFAVWWYLRRAREEERAAAEIAALTAAEAAQPAAPPAPAAAPSPTAAPPTGFRRIDPPARAALLARLAARRAGQPAPAPAAPPLPGAVDPAAVLDSIMPLVPALQDCYDETRARRTATKVAVGFDLTLEGDAEVGTLITDIKLTGDAAFDADPALGTCLRETMLAVELPPLAQGSSAFVRTTMELLDDPAAAAVDAGR